MIVNTVGVIGSGLMGSGIAQVAATNGLDVLLVDVDPAKANGAVASIEQRLQKDVARGRMEADAATSAMGRIQVRADAGAMGSLADVDAVIEAVVEQMDVKSRLFYQLGRVCKPEALLCSNTSSLPLSDLAAASGRPASVIGLHFFNPPWALKLVEVVTTASTTEETLEGALAICARLDRAPVQVKDTPGFIANRLLVPFIFDAIQLMDSGVATAEHVDTACKLGLNHTMGPLATADLIGLDTLMFIAESMFEEYGEPRFKAPTLLRRLVALGHLGRKSGRGFFKYA